MPVYFRLVVIVVSGVAKFEAARNWLRFSTGTSPFFKKMVEFGSGPVKETIDNTVFIIPGIIIGLLVGENETTNTGAKPEFGKVAVGDSTSTIAMFMIFTLVIGSVLGFFTYKLVSSLRNKQRLKEEKKKLKQQKKDKELQKKIKKK